MFSTVDTGACTSTEEMQLFGSVTVEEAVAVDPKCPFSVHLAKVVEVELSDEGLEASVTEKGWQGFTLKSS